MPSEDKKRKFVTLEPLAGPKKNEKNILDQIKKGVEISYQGAKYTVTETPNIDNKNKYILVHESGKPVYKLTAEELFKQIEYGDVQPLMPEATAISKEELTEEEKSKAISGAQSFEELYSVLDKMGGIESSQKTYTAEELKEEILFLRNIWLGLSKEDRERSDIDASLAYITSAGGLRLKVKELLIKEDNDKRFTVKPLVRKASLSEGKKIEGGKEELEKLKREEIEIREAIRNLKEQLLALPDDETKQEDIKTTKIVAPKDSIAIYGRDEFGNPKQGGPFAPRISEPINLAKSNINTFPILGTFTGKEDYIPELVARKAYDQYVRKYGSSQSFETIKRRGGFDPQEMDSLYPPWRKESIALQASEPHLHPVEGEPFTIEPKKIEYISNVQISETIKNLLNKNEAISDVKSVKVEGKGEELNLNIDVKASGFNIGVQANLQNEDNTIGLKSYHINANFLAKPFAKEKLDPYLNQVSELLKAFIEKEKGKKVESIQIENGNLRVIFEK